jgi:hypothetical protein
MLAASPRPAVTDFKATLRPAMLRIHGDRTSLLAALTAHWAEQQLQIPPVLRPAVAPIRRQPRPSR